MPIDIKTVFVGYIFSNLFAVIVMAILWQQNKKQLPETRQWLIFSVLQFFGLILIIQRNIIPDFLTIILANTLFIFGIIMLLSGLNQYFGKKTGQVHNYLLLLVFLCVHVFFTYFHPSFEIRNINFSSGILILSIQGSWLMLRQQKTGLAAVARAAGIVCVLYLVINVINIAVNISNIFYSQPLNSFPFNPIRVLSERILFLALIYVLYLLINRRLLMVFNAELSFRKQTEESLLESRQQFQGLVETLYDWVWEADVFGIYTYASPKIENILGYKPEEILGKFLTDLMSVNDAKLVADLFGSCVKEEKPIISLEIKKIHKDGHWVTLETNALPFYDNEGKLKGYRGTDRDTSGRKRIENDLRRNRRFLSELIEHSGTIICVKDTECRYELVNRKWEQTSGFNREFVYGKTDMELFPGEDSRQIFLNDAEVLRSGKIMEFSIERDHPEGKRSYIAVVFPLRDGDKIIGISSIATEITAHKRAEELLAAERQRLTYIIEGTNVGTWEWNVQTGETKFNDRWAEIIGYKLSELEPVSIRTWEKFAHPDDLLKSNELLEKHFNKELPYYEFECRMQHRDGRWIWIYDRGKVMTWTDDDKPLIMYGTHQDITERKLAEEQIRFLATHDALTGLPSLKLARDRLNQALGMARRYRKIFAVMFIDLDGFKEVNDSYGHEAGDFVLSQIAERLSSSVRETDTVARVGGDEFLIIATELQSRDDTTRIAKNTIYNLARPIAFNGHEVEISASIGIAFYPYDGEESDQLINKADKAMYSVKYAGKNNFAFVKN